MNKKLLAPILLSFFVLWMSVAGREEAKIKTTEPLVCADTGFGYIYDVEIIDVTSETSFVSDSLLRFHVPGSPKNDALFFEWWTTFVYAWSDYETRRVACKICLKIVSDVIPDNIDVGFAFTVYREYRTDDFLNSNIIRKRIERMVEIFMWRDSVEKWYVTDKSGGQVPDEEVIPIFNKLIDNGFNVEVWAEGKVQGMKVASYRNVTIEVSRFLSN